MSKMEKNRKENHATKVTKKHKTKIWDERNIKPKILKTLCNATHTQMESACMTAEETSILI